MVYDAANKPIDVHLVAAARSGDVSMIHSAMRGGADVNFHDQEGWCALHEAAGAGHVDACAVLIGNYNAPVDATNKLGWTALHWAASVGNLNTVKALVKTFGADPQK